MRNPWLAIDLSRSPTSHARRLRQAWEGYLSGDEPTAVVRRVVQDSWKRSEQAGIPPEHYLAPVIFSDIEVLDRWQDHPLAPVMTVLREYLAAVAEDAEHLVVVSDADGLLVWMEGSPAVRSRAEEMQFVPGALWSESAAGTNAIGTALAVDHPIQIFAAEHFNANVHGWTCSAAPIHDPETGHVLGAIDLTGKLRTVHPHSLALVGAAARMAESLLLYDRTVRRSLQSEPDVFIPGRPRAGAERATSFERLPHAQPEGRVMRAVSSPVASAASGAVEISQTPSDQPPLAPPSLIIRRSITHPKPIMRLEALGRDRAAIWTADHPMILSRRHSEIVVVLAEHPQGIPGADLATAIYGDFANPITMRAEIARLRRLLGEWLHANPYRLAIDLQADFLELESLLRQGKIREAVRRYHGPILPTSDAPAIVEAREHLEMWIREAVLSLRDLDVLWTWANGISGQDDLEVWETTLELLDGRDSRWAITMARVQQLQRSYGLSTSSAIKRGFAVATQG